MKGEITSIDLEHKAVSIEVPLTEGMFTVSGPFSPDAVLKKAGACVRLADFEVGEGVEFKWKHTGQGYIILFLGSR